MKQTNVDLIYQTYPELIYSCQAKFVVRTARGHRKVAKRPAMCCPAVMRFAAMGLKMCCTRSIAGLRNVLHYCVLTVRAGRRGIAPSIAGCMYCDVLR